MSAAHLIHCFVCRLTSALIACAPFVLLGAPAKPQEPLVKVSEHRMKFKRQGAAVAAVGEHLYVFGGYDSGMAIGHVERFNIGTAAVEVVSDRAIARRMHAAIEHNGRIYLFGGEGHTLDGQYERAVEIFDPTSGTFERGVSSPRPARGAAVAKVGHRVYVIGGLRYRGPQRGYSGETDAFDLQSGTWTAAAPFPFACESEALALGSFVLVLGGFNGQRALDQISLYHVAQNNWRPLPPLSRATSAHSVAQLGRWVFLFGDYHDLDSILAYDLETRKTVRFRADFRGLRHTAALTYRERIYVVGGNRTTESGYESDLIQVFALNPYFDPE